MARILIITRVQNDDVDGVEFDVFCEKTTDGGENHLISCFLRSPFLHFPTSLDVNLMRVCSDGHLIFFILPCAFPLLNEVEWNTYHTHYY